MRAIIVFMVLILMVACDKAPVQPGPATPPPITKQIPPCGLDAATETVVPALHDLTLIGGLPADISKWQASVYARAGSSACSSTLIGERVLLSAGHCMANGGKVSFTAGANQYTAVCTHHPEYKGNSTADWSLCLIDRPVTGVQFESLATKFNIRTGDTVRLSGYGCITPGGGGGNDGIFRTGTAQVSSLPSGTNYDVVTKGGAALCFGDSGGAAYLEYSDGKREIFGVNSRGNISNTSYLPAVASTSAQSFYEEWSKKNGVRICGLHSDARACRNIIIDPPQPPPQPGPELFEIKGYAACIRGKMNQGYEGKKDALVKALTDTLNALK